MYNIKVYTTQTFTDLSLSTYWDFIFKRTLSNKKISSQIRFSNEMNIWFWNLSFAYNESDTTHIVNWDMIEVWKDWNIIYWWKVTNKVVMIDNWGVKQNIECKWYQTILNNFYYKNAWNTTFTKTDDAKNIITDIITQWNEELDYFSTDFTNLDLVWSNVSIEFQNDKLYTALRKVMWLTIYYLSMRANKKIYFKPISTTPDHNLTLWNDIKSINIEYNSDDIVNDITYNYDWWTLSDTDAQSKYDFWSNRLIQEDLQVQNSATAQKWIDNIFMNKAITKDTIRVDVNNNYDVFTIYPWQTISINNSPIEIKSKVVRRIDYNDDWCVLYLNTKDTIEKALSSLI